MRFFSYEKCLLFLDAAPGRLDHFFATLPLEGAGSSEKETHQVYLITATLALAAPLSHGACSAGLIRRCFLLGSDWHLSEVSF